MILQGEKQVLTGCFHIQKYTGQNGKLFTVIEISTGIKHVIIVLFNFFENPAVVIASKLNRKSTVAGEHLNAFIRAFIKFTGAGYLKFHQVFEP